MNASSQFECGAFEEDLDSMETNMHADTFIRSTCIENIFNKHITLVYFGTEFVFDSEAVKLFKMLNHSGIENHNAESDTAIITVLFKCDYEIMLLNKF